ncbi:hypothetical protein O181_064498 [Austropuccinia psidii MF-1]|uniref:Uncharacterized protein n=1 Tax=Austropuccinia psidii MF-1 TaxID=1389203 RepID=A0A9Q3I1P1_9BASI|nr:hypothetical protein [Austropuccinia psidii MF-1]
MSSSTFNLNLNLAYFDNPLEYAILAKNLLKSPIPDDNGFEIFDPHGLFSPPCPHLPSEDTQLNSRSLQKDHHPNPLQPQSTSCQICSSLISAATCSWGLDCSKSMLKPHIIRDAFVNLNKNSLHNHSDNPFQSFYIPVPTIFDDTIPNPPPHLTSPLYSPILPCSSLFGRICQFHHSLHSTSNVLASLKLVDEDDQVAGYTLGTIIFCGEFSVVWKAHHIASNQNLSIKIVCCSEPIASADYPPSLLPFSYHSQHQNQINALRKAKPPVMLLHSSLNS